MEHWKGGPGFATYLGTGELEAASPDVRDWRTPEDCARLRDIVRLAALSPSVPCLFTVRDASIRLLPLESDGPARFLAIFERSPEKASPLAALSARRQQTARLAGLGLNVQEIAGDMKLSPNTVKSHLRHIYEALGVSNRAELARVVAAEGHNE